MARMIPSVVDPESADSEKEVYEEMNRQLSPRLDEENSRSRCRLP